MTLTASFGVEPHDEAVLKQLDIAETEVLSVRKTFTSLQDMSVEILASTPIASELRIDISNMTLPQIRLFAQERSLELPGGTKREPNASALHEWIKSQPQTRDWSPVSQAIFDIMPDYEIVRDTRDPESIVHQFLNRVYRSALEDKKYRGRLDRLISALYKDLRKQASALVEPIRRYVPEVENVIVDPSFSFDNALRSTSLQIVGKDGNPIDLSMRGAGLRQKVTMAVL